MSIETRMGVSGFMARLGSKKDAGHPVKLGRLSMKIARPRCCTSRSGRRPKHTREDSAGTSEEVVHPFMRGLRFLSIPLSAVFSLRDQAIGLSGATGTGRGDAGSGAGDRAPAPDGSSGT